MMTTPGPDRQDVAAERRELLVGHLDQPDAEVAEQLPQTDREQRQVDDREVVGDGRDDRHQVDELGRAAPVRDVEDPDVAADQIAASWRAPASLVRSVRPMQNRSGRSQNVSPPSMVPGASIRPDRRDAGVGGPRLEHVGLGARGSACRAGAGSRRDR